jgi:hypothetical protein
LAFVVDGLRDDQIPASESSQVDDLAAFPNDAMHHLWSPRPDREYQEWIDVPILRESSNFTKLVNPESLTVGASRKRAEICQVAILPFQCMFDETIGTAETVWVHNGCIRSAYDYSVIV